jgi:uncharacterized membrane protein
MRHIEEVEELDDTRSRWVARTPVGKEVEWYAIITEEEPGRLLRWRSLPESEIETEGLLELRDAPAGRGTVVHVEMELRPADGQVGRSVAAFLRPAIAKQVHEDMRRFKNLMEAGDRPHDDAAMRRPQGHIEPHDAL